MPEINLSAISANVVWYTFVIAALMGAIIQKTRFCTMGAVTDIVIVGEWTRMRQWILAMGVVILGLGLMTSFGLIDTTKTFYTTSRITWLSTAVGSVMFGLGMVLASGCGSKTLVRIGSGNLKSLIVFLTLALSSYMTLRGVFGVLRVNTVDTVALTLSTPQDLPSILSAQWGISKTTLQWSLGAFLGGGLIVVAMSQKRFLTFDNLLAGFGVGFAILAVWWVSGVVGYVAEDPNTLEEVFVATNSGRMESLTFVAPYAYLVEWLTFFSDTSKKITLGISSVLGVVFGSFVYSLVTKTFHVETFRNAEDTANHLIGGVLMGVGGVTAMGCTIGQGLTGLSTLSINAFIALPGYMLGAYLGMKYLNWRLLPPPCEPITMSDFSFQTMRGCGMPLQIACHTENFGTLGQIGPDDVSEIARQGFKSIINNRPDGEGGPEQPLSADIETAAKALGLHYAYLPVISGQITQEQAQAMAKLLEEMPQPVLAFCRSGARSTNLYMLAQQFS